MKRILIVIAVAAGIAGCNSRAENNQKAKVDSVKILRDSLKLDSFKRAEVAKKEAEETARQQALAAQAAAANARRSNYSSSNGSNTSTASVQEQPRKKGWSSAAKGAAIGGGAGIVTGILVDKKDARGAIIGGAVGAGTGYVIGRSRDRKSGRVQPKN